MNIVETATRFEDFMANPNTAKDIARMEEIDAMMPASIRSPIMDPSVLLKSQRSYVEALPNGLTVSIQWSINNYCNGKYSLDYASIPIESVEVAIFAGDDSIANLYDESMSESVRGWVDLNEVKKIYEWAKSIEPEMISEMATKSKILLYGEEELELKEEPGFEGELDPEEELEEELLGVIRESFTNISNDPNQLYTIASMEAEESVGNLKRVPLTNYFDRDTTTEVRIPGGDKFPNLREKMLLTNREKEAIGIKEDIIQISPKDIEIDHEL